MRSVCRSLLSIVGCRTGQHGARGMGGLEELAECLLRWVKGRGKGVHGLVFVCVDGCGGYGRIAVLQLLLRRVEELHGFVYGIVLVSQFSLIVVESPMTGRPHCKWSAHQVCRS